MDRGSRDAVMVLVVFACGATLAVFFAVWIARNISRALIPYIPEKYERALGELAAGSIAGDARPFEPLNRMMQSVAKGISFEGFEIRLLCTDVPNAMTFPGKHFAVTSGLLSLLENEAELQAILGHEIGHSVHRDPLIGLGAAIWQALFLQVLYGSLGLGSESILIESLGDLTALTFDRDQEYAADEFGIALLQKAVGSTLPAVTAFEKLLGYESKLGHGALGSLPTFLSTHPEISDRILRIRQLAKQRGWSLDRIKSPLLAPLAAEAHNLCKGPRKPENTEEPDGKTSEQNAQV